MVVDPCVGPGYLVEVCLPVRLDDAVRRRVRDAGERIPGTDLRVVQERLVRLVDGALQHLAGARGARTSAAGVRGRRASPCRRRRRASLASL